MMISEWSLHEFKQTSSRNRLGTESIVKKVVVFDHDGRVKMVVAFDRFTMEGRNLTNLLYSQPVTISIDSLSDRISFEDVF